MRIILRFTHIVACLLSCLAHATSGPSLDNKFELIKKSPSSLAAFIADMPVGGDLHNHLAGSPSVGTMLDIATAGQYSICPGYVICQPDINGARSIFQVLKRPRSTQKIISAWSMDKAERSKSESDHDHFFETFYKFGEMIPGNRAKMLAAIKRSAAQQKIHYLELILVSDDNAAVEIANTITWDADFQKFQQNLLRAGLRHLVYKIQRTLDRIEQESSKLLGCNTDNTQAVCHMPVRYHSAALRNLQPDQVFSQLLLGFELAKRDPRIVAVNLVQAEDGDVSIRDYRLHMRMLNFLHKQYPNVKISLHAGELTSDLTPAKELSYHISDAVNIGHANRIGHGLSIKQEENLGQLAKTLKQRDILVEINLSSNEKILHVTHKTHPLPWYLKQGIPVALSTDDAGILLIDMNHEYLKAVKEYDLNYTTLRMMNRNSLQYSFLSGMPLWENTRHGILQKPCRDDSPGSKKLSPSCRRFLAHNEKANQQWLFEIKLKKFESIYFKKS